MASLVGNAINASCAGLIKTDDNAIIGATEKRVTDGLGNATNMTIGTGGTSFDSGTVDFTGATVSGLPSAAGLESGTGTDSMQSAASLTTVAANASGACTIALGDGANSAFNGGVAIGDTATITAAGGVAIGCLTSAGDGAVAIGPGTNSSCAQSVTIGNYACQVNLGGGVAIGRLAASGTNSVGVGNVAKGCGDSSVAVGFDAVASATEAVALGANVDATKACTVTVKELETCVAGGGIYLTTPDGLAQPKLTVNNSSELLIGGNPVGGGGAAGLESGTGTDSMQSAASLTTTAADASGECSIALGNGAVATNSSIALGRGASTTNFGAVAIGCNACAISGIKGSVAIGKNTCAPFNGSLALGDGTETIGVHAISIGQCAVASAHSVAIGRLAAGLGDFSIAIGRNACASIGCAVAIGCGVTAAKANTVTVKELETCVAGGGVYLTTPDGLAQPKLTVNNSSELLIGGNPVGGGAAGLESGTGTDSMQSAASLTTTAANASGSCSIALGNGAVGSDRGVALGDGAITCGSFNINIGAFSKTKSNSNGGIAIGRCSAQGPGAIAIGNTAHACGIGGIVLRSTCNVFASAAVFNGTRAIAIGDVNPHNFAETIGIGRLACHTASQTIVIGDSSCATVSDAVALGRSVTASKAGTVTVKELELQTVGGGITLYSPNGTEYKLTVNDSGDLVVA